MIVQALRTARAIAVRTGTTTRFALDGGGRSTAIDGVAQPPLTDGFALAAIDRPGLRFFADGSSDGGRFALSTANLRADITVYPSTGVVTTTRRQ